MFFPALPQRTRWLHGLDCHTIYLATTCRLSTQARHLTGYNRWTCRDWAKKCSPQKRPIPALRIPHPRNFLLILSKVQMLTLVLGVGVFSLLPILETPCTSQNFPNFPRSSLPPHTVDSRSNPEVPRKFPDFPRSFLDLPRSNRTSPEANASPCLASLTASGGYSPEFKRGATEMILEHRGLPANKS